MVEDLCNMLAYMSANQVLSKGIHLEIAVQDGQVDIKEAK